MLPCLRLMPVSMQALSLRLFNHPGRPTTTSELHASQPAGKHASRKQRVASNMGQELRSRACVRALPAQRMPCISQAVLTLANGTSTSGSSYLQP